jgi:hypothetical protein
MELLFTGEGHKGQCAGFMILKYGCDMADIGGLEAHIDASQAPSTHPVLLLLLIF